MINTIIKTMSYMLLAMFINQGLAADESKVNPVKKESVKCNLIEEASVHIDNKSEYPFHIHIKDKTLTLDLTVKSGKEGKYCIPHGHVLDGYLIYGKSKDGKIKRGPTLPLKQLWFSAKHLDISITQEDQKAPEYELKLDTHPR